MTRISSTSPEPESHRCRSAPKIHFCLGAPLARLEGSLLFPILVARFPGLQLVEQPRWRTGLSFRGLSSLKVATR